MAVLADAAKVSKMSSMEILELNMDGEHDLAVAVVDVDAAAAGSSRPLAPESFSDALFVRTARDDLQIRDLGPGLG